MTVLRETRIRTLRWAAATGLLPLVAVLGATTTPASAAVARQSTITARAATVASSSLSITSFISNFSTLRGATSVVTAGHYAYVAVYGSGAPGSSRLSIVDIADPSHPVVVGSTDDLRLAGADGVVVAGRYAYVAATNSNSLVVVDIDDADAPSVIGAVRDDDLLNQAYTVFVAGHYAYVAAQGCVASGSPCTDPRGNILTIIDFSDPTAPAIVGDYRDPTATHHVTSVYVVGGRAYLTAAYSATVSVVNVTNPTSPTLAGSITDSTDLPFPVDVWVDPSGQYAYVVSQASTGRLTALDVHSQTDPVVVGSVASSALLSGAYWLTVAGPYAFVAAAGSDAMTVVDVADPTSPSIIDSIASSSSLALATAVFVANGEAYIAAYGSNALTAVSVGAYVTGTDTTAPKTSITSAPDGSTTSSSASFAFSATDGGAPEPDATFECKLDSGDWTMCATPQSYSGLGSGTHTFLVRATDSAGNLDPDPPAWTWTIADPADQETNLSPTPNSPSAPSPPSTSSPPNFTAVPTTAAGPGSHQTVYAAQPVAPSTTARLSGAWWTVRVRGLYRPPLTLHGQPTCSGSMTLTLNLRGRVLATAHTRLLPGCTYTGDVRLGRHAVGATRKLTLTVHLSGAAQLLPVSRTYVIRLRG